MSDPSALSETSASAGGEGARFLPALSFDASQLAPSERFEHWRERTATSYELRLPNDVSQEDFRSRTRMWCLGSHLITVGEYTPMVSERTPRLVSSDQFNHLALRMNLARSGARLDAGGKRLVLAAGEPVLMDMTRPATFDSPGGTGMVVFFPRDVLADVLPSGFDLHGIVPRGAAAQLLVSHLVNLSKQLSQLTADEASGVAVATASLLAVSLLATSRTQAHVQPAIEAALMQQICRWIESALGDPSLSVSSVCRKFKVSRSTMYRLFETRGGVAEYIKERRLKRIHAAIIAPENAARQLVGIAEEFGLGNASHFSRIFRHHFGYSPSDAREQTPATFRLLATNHDARTYFEHLRELQR